MVLPEPRGGGAGMAGNEGTVLRDGGGTVARGICSGCGKVDGGCRGREALRALDDDRAGTLAGGMLYILELL